MKMLFVSESGYGLGIAAHLTSEGHNVSFAVKPSFNIGNGIVDNIVSLNAGMLKDELCSNGAPDMVVFDGETMYEVADEFRQSNFRVVGASRWSNVIASDVPYTNSVIKAIGWDTDSVKTGTHLHVTCWYNGVRYLSTYVSLSYRRFMPNGAGLDIGFSGALANFKQPTSRVIETFLKPLDKFLKKAGHRGCFHIHALIDRDRVSVKDLSASFHHPLALLLFENTNLTVTSILLKLFNESSPEIKPIDTWAGGALLSVPPFPYQAPETPIEIKGAHPENLKHLWLTDVYREGHSWKMSGATGILGYVTARGEFREEIARRINRTAENLGIPSLQYRNDIGRNITKRLHELRQNGWMEFSEQGE